MINKVTLIGNLGGDPEIKRLENGTAVGRFSLATNESYKDKEGNWQTITEWHNIVVWRDQAESAEKHLKKGMLVYVEGKISYRKYTAQDGTEKTSTDIVCAHYRKLEKSENKQDTRFPSEEPPGNPGQTPSTTNPAGQTTGGAPMPGNVEDLPF